MRLVLWLRERVRVPGEPPVDRIRKEFVATYFCFFSVVGVLYALYATLLIVFSRTQRELSGSIFLLVAAVAAECTFTSVVLYVHCTRRISRWLCEVSMVLMAFVVLCIDVGLLIRGWESCSVCSIILLDFLLICRCSPNVTGGVLAGAVLWMLCRAVLLSENAVGDPCAAEPARWSAEYVSSVFNAFFPSAYSIIVDFKFTRSFADSMTEQKELVDASIAVSEQAAFRLSRYQTEGTKELLHGPEGARVPGGLRAALLQLVDNLAVYRPYLPQSCLPRVDVDEDEEEGEEGSEGGYARVHEDRPSAAAVASPCSRKSLQSGAGSACTPDDTPPGSYHRPSFITDVRQRNVSLLAVNSKSFLSAVAQGHGAVNAFVRGSVDAFLGEVGSERGVVEFVSGDHMFANFNASRLCTTHRASATRVAWSMAAPGISGLGTVRTACVCNGQVLCGDIGTSEMRRFMLLGGTVNAVQCLERVAAQLGTVLLDGAVASDADVVTQFFSVLVERVLYPKRAAKPFLVWRLDGVRDGQGDPGEWMYELEQREPNPHDAWNARMEEWLNFGKPFAEATSERPAWGRLPTLSKKREQSFLVEATVVGGTVACSAADDAQQCALPT